jgi:hypothetical protein
LTFALADLNINLYSCADRFGLFKVKRLSHEILQTFPPSGQVRWVTTQLNK